MASFLSSVALKVGSRLKKQQVQGGDPELLEFLSAQREIGRGVRECVAEIKTFGDLTDTAGETVDGVEMISEAESAVLHVTFDRVFREVAMRSDDPTAWFPKKGTVPAWMAAARKATRQWMSNIGCRCGICRSATVVGKDNPASGISGRLLFERNVAEALSLCRLPKDSDVPGQSLGKGSVVCAHWPEVGSSVAKAKWGKVRLKMKVSAKAQPFSMRSINQLKEMSGKKTFEAHWRKWVAMCVVVLDMSLYWLRIRTKLVEIFNALLDVDSNAKVLKVHSIRVLGRVMQGIWPQGMTAT